MRTAQFGASTRSGASRRVGAKKKWTPDERKSETGALDRGSHFLSAGRIGAGGRFASDGMQIESLGENEVVFTFEEGYSLESRCFMIKICAVNQSFLLLRMSTGVSLCL